MKKLLEQTKTGFLVSSDDDAETLSLFLRNLDNDSKIRLLNGCLKILFNIDLLQNVEKGPINPVLPVFLRHPKTAQGIKMKLSYFKNTPFRHILQVKTVSYILNCCHGNKITKDTSQNLAPKKSEKLAICSELKFGIETKFGALSSETSMNAQFDIIMT